eukprot:13494914-Alexandrium_andersonii.AAC.1
MAKSSSAPCAQVPTKWHAGLHKESSNKHGRKQTPEFPPHTDQHGQGHGPKQFKLRIYANWGAQPL